MRTILSTRQLGFMRRLIQQGVITYAGLRRFDQRTVLSALVNGWIHDDRKGSITPTADGLRLVKEFGSKAPTRKHVTDLSPSVQRTLYRQRKVRNIA